jgi:hypothetical protein
MLLGLILLLMVVLLFFEEDVGGGGVGGLIQCYSMCVSPFPSLVRKVKCTTWLAKLEEMITFTLKDALMTTLLSLVDEELVSLCGAAMFWKVCWQDCRCIASITASRVIFSSCHRLQMAILFKKEQVPWCSNHGLSYVDWRLASGSHANATCCL